MPDASTLQLAIAGGTGAFAGATIGNLIQVGRDWFNGRTAQRNREQDLRREAYTAAFPNLLKLRKILLEQQSSTSIASHVADFANTPAVQERIRKNAEAAAKCAAELVATMQSETLGFASPEVFDAVEALYYNSYLWPGMATQKMRVMVDEKMLDRLLAEGVNHAEAVDQYTADSNLRDQTDAEHLDSLHSGATGSLAQANTLLHQMRTEIGLTREPESSYLVGRRRQSVPDILTTDHARRRPRWWRWPRRR